ncbi:hybrid sensor histidine kinase/response regulator [Vacuolonema iberomarrocanum]|uniref:hybrid sensor histidine kinase/response regulator n=1 Tax=Vacuolonema iberomarrocanum TaxID=3454632 RepID=UPI0019DE740E|nr:hybrid sensor histidine kinase/response regulator [filamentous cyanobacterium LEGE 07170]
MDHPSILVIDDEPNNFDVIESLLSKQPYELQYAYSGKEAIAFLDTFQPDLILLDVMMPDMDGIEVCKRIKTLPAWQATPIIMITALNAKEDLERCLNAGADDFISKPVNSMELRARVNSMLRIKSQYDSISSLVNLRNHTLSLLQNSLDELRGTISSSLPHELNTPLTGLAGTLDLLLTARSDMEEEEVHELLTMARQSSLRLKRLTERFLNYAQLELLSNKITAGIQQDESSVPSCCPTQTLIETSAALKASATSRMDDLSCDIEDKLVALNSTHLQWIIDELMDNALKFSSVGTPITVKSQVDHQFHLFICDQGRGMTPEQINQIEAFIQFERKTYEQQGIGLGLKIAQKVTELYGGKFLISSHYQKGTDVHITLPLAPSA